MKTTNLLIISILLLAGIASATISFDKDKMQIYLDEKYPDKKITIIGESTKYKMDKHIAMDELWDNKTYTRLMSENDYEENVEK